MTKFDIKCKRLLTGLIVVIVLGCVLAGGFKLVLSEVFKSNSDLDNSMVQLEWSYISQKIEEYTAQATAQADVAAEELKELLTVEAENGNIESGFTTTEEGIELLGDLSTSVISGVYLNGIESDNNDMLVSTRERVVADNSLSTAVMDEEGLEWDTYVSSHYNSRLGDIAGLSRRQQTAKQIFWERIPPIVDNHYIVSDMMMSELEHVYKTEGLDGLYSYEFFGVSYINKNTDILGNPDVDKGIFTQNDKIVVGQGYSFYEQFTNDTTDYAFYNAMVQEHQNALMHKRNNFILLASLIGILIVGLIAISFFLMNSLNLAMAAADCECEKKND